MSSFSSRRRKVKLKTAGSGKRAIVVFGPPAVGISTVLSCLKEASETPMEIVPYLGSDSIAQAEEAMHHAEIVLLDVDGGVFNENDVQDVVDNRLVFANSGAVVRMYAPDEVILERASSRPDYVTSEDLKTWSRQVTNTEDRIRQHTLNYFMIPNLDLEEAVKQLALRAGIKK